MLDTRQGLDAVGAVADDVGGSDQGQPDGDGQQGYLAALAVDFRDVKVGPRRHLQQFSEVEVAAVAEAVAEVAATVDTAAFIIISVSTSVCVGHSIHNSINSLLLFQ